MSDLSREAIQAVDPAGMIDDVLAQHAQLEDALWRVDSAGLERRDLPGGLVVAGMGGSAVGGDLATAAIGERAERPVRTVRGYGLDRYVGPDTLVLCASYSGDTEETLACYAAARDAGSPRVVVTTGGELAELARADGVPVIGVPSGMQPRAAVAYMTVAALECASLSGAAPSLREEIQAASGLLRELAGEWGPDATSDSRAKGIAAALHGTIPIVYGAAATAASARRWKTQINENASMHAFASELPEADHNEVCGYEGEPRPGALAAVFLDDAAMDPRLRRRIEVTVELVAPGAAMVERIEAPGGNPTERVLALVLLGDLVSVYLAALSGVDPTPVEAIQRLKRKLA
jgi:glucose/mannose-6-phosphate isomerase